MAVPEPTRTYESPPVDLAPGKVFGGYRIESLLGTGGMGAVYRATDPGLGRHVALKVVRPEIDRPDAHARLLREARAAAAVVHDHVVRVYQVGEDGGIPFIAMELLSGQSLAARIAAGPIPVPEVVRIATEAATGLMAVHAAGLVHRDLKPANLWLEAGNGRVKLLDFGLARSNEDSVLTRPGAVLGTPAYMAPEQAAGLPVDPRADLFSLGCVLYHLATGERAFDGPNVLAVLNRLSNHTPTPADAINPKVPHALAQLINELMAKNPGDRPSSAAAVASRLAKLDLACKPAPPSSQSCDTWSVSAVDESPSDHQRLLNRLLELKVQQGRVEFFTRDNLFWWLYALLSLPGYPLLGWLLSQLVLDHTVPRNVDPFVIIGILVALFTWAIPPAWNARRRFERNRTQLLEKLSQEFPREMANWGGPLALTDQATLTAIISRLQGL